MKLNEPNILKIRLHEVFLDRNISPVRVMLTGDWHISPIVSSQQLDFLKQAIAKAKPEMIILQGDLVDSPIELRRETSLKKLLLELRVCSQAAPTVLVLGSHDYITPTIPAKNMYDFAIPCWRKICKVCGVKLLMNEWFVHSPKLRIFGAFQDERCIIEEEIDDGGKTGSSRNAKISESDNRIIRKEGHSDKRIAYKDSPNGFLKCLNECNDIIDKELKKKFGGVTWFASHAPLLNDEVVEKLKPFDVASFGHTHGGIVPLGLDELFEKFDLHFGLISANHTPFPRNVRGAKPISDSTMLVVNPGMIATHFCVNKFLQNMNFIKAAEVSIVQLSSKKEDIKPHKGDSRRSGEEDLSDFFGN